MIPWRIKQSLRPALLSLGILAFRRGFRNTRLFQWLISGWGNEGWGADTAYLQAMCNWARQVRGPILECGSGLTTLLLGMIAPGRVTTLEHLPEWRSKAQQIAARHAITVNVLHTPLVSYGAFDWYSLSDSLPNGYQLVVCDGPPSTTRGGRFGLLPVARTLLAPTAVILMDDAERPDEQAILQRWRTEFGVACEQHQTPSGAYAVITVERATAQA